MVQKAGVESSYKYEIKKTKEEFPIDFTPLKDYFKSIFFKLMSDV
jgi:hypothetical protein